MFSALVCDLLPRRLFHRFAKGASWHCQKSISVTILTSTVWRTLGLFGAFPTRARGGEGASCRAPHGHDQISREFFFPDLRPLQVGRFPTCDGKKRICVYFSCKRSLYHIGLCCSESVLSKTAIFPQKEGRKREISNESARGSWLRERQRLGERQRRTA